MHARSRALTAATPSLRQGLASLCLTTTLFGCGGLFPQSIRNFEELEVQTVAEFNEAGSAQLAVRLMLQSQNPGWGCVAATTQVFYGDARLISRTPEAPVCDDVSPMYRVLLSPDQTLGFLSEERVRVTFSDPSETVVIEPLAGIVAGDDVFTLARANEAPPEAYPLEIFPDDTLVLSVATSAERADLAKAIPSLANNGRNVARLASMSGSPDYPLGKFALIGISNAAVPGAGVLRVLVPRYELGLTDDCSEDLTCVHEDRWLLVEVPVEISANPATNRR